MFCSASKRFRRFRSSRPEVFRKEGVFKIKILKENTCWSLFYGLRPATLLKKRLQQRCFLVNSTKFLRTPFFIKHLRWLLLNVYSIFTLGFTATRLKSDCKAWFQKKKRTKKKTIGTLIKKSPKMKGEY